MPTFFISMIDAIIVLKIVWYYVVHVMMNGGRFKGCNRFIRKTESGSVIPEYYKRKEYAKIVNYIQNEAVAFHEAFSELRSRLNMS